MWLILSTCAAILWGMTYVLDERIFRQVSVPTTMAIQFVAIAIMFTLLVGG